MSKLMLALCLLLSGVCFVPALSIAADDKADAKEDAKADKEEAKEGDAPKKEQPKLVKEKEKKPKTTIEWTEITSKSGTLKKPAYKKGKQPEPTKVEFTSEAPAVRIKWTTKAPEGKRGGSMTMSLFKKKESRGSEDKATYQRIDRIGSARGDSEGSKTVAVGKGEFSIELEGDAIDYEITIEYPEKKTE